MTTALEFEQQYAENGGMTVTALRARGRVVVPCLDAGPGGTCKQPDCAGWNSITADLVDDYKMMGRIPKGWVWPP